MFLIKSCLLSPATYTLFAFQTAFRPTLSDQWESRGAAASALGLLRELISGRAVVWAMTMLPLGKQIAYGHLSKLVSPRRPFGSAVLIEVTWFKYKVKAGEEFTPSKKKSGCRAFAQQGILVRAYLWVGTECVSCISRSYYSLISV